MANDSLGDRIKKYESITRIKITERMPVILRLDGCHFHTYTKKCKRPFDENLIHCMNKTAIYLCKNIQNARLAYIQSDEINILLVNYEKIDSQSWFDNILPKMCSVSAGMASAFFTSISDKIFGQIKLATFDARAFVVPREDVNNTFLWRQKDMERNSVQMLARSMYSDKECHKKNNSQLQEMTFQKGVNWNDLPTSQKRGRCVIKQFSTKENLNPKTQEQVVSVRSEWVVDNEIPIFSQDRQYIEKLI